MGRFQAGYPTYNERPHEFFSLTTYMTLLILLYLYANLANIQT